MVYYQPWIEDAALIGRQGGGAKDRQAQPVGGRGGRDGGMTGLRRARRGASYHLCVGTDEESRAGELLSLPCRGKTNRDCSAPCSCGLCVPPLSREGAQGNSKGAVRNQPATLTAGSSKGISTGAGRGQQRRERGASTH